LAGLPPLPPPTSQQRARLRQAGNELRAASNVLSIDGAAALREVAREGRSLMAAMRDAVGGVVGNSSNSGASGGDGDGGGVATNGVDGANASGGVAAVALFDMKVEKWRDDAWHVLSSNDDDITQEADTQLHILLVE
jgi:hypothetical protein